MPINVLAPKGRASHQLVPEPTFPSARESSGPLRDIIYAANMVATRNHEDTPKKAPRKVLFHSYLSSLGWGSRQNENQNRTNAEKIFRARAQYI